MRNRTGLIAAVALLFVVLGSLGFWAARRAARSPEPGLSRVPGDAFLVASVDASRLRMYPPASRMRWALVHLPEISRVLTALHAGCGVDPIDRLDTLTFAWDRSALLSGAAHGWSVVLDGRFERRQWQHCLEAAAQSAGGRAVPLGPVARHDTFGFAGDGQPLPSPLAWFALGERGIVAAPPDGLARVLATADGTGSSAAGNERLRAALGPLGGGALAFVAVDVATVAQVAPQEWASAVASALSGTPAAGAMPALLSARSFAAAIQTTPSGMRIVASARMDSSAHAQSVVTALTRWRDAGRVDFAQWVASAQGDVLAKLQSAQAFEPGIAAQALPVQRAGLLLGELYDRARVRGDGTTVTWELSLATSDVATLEAAARAAMECDAAFERTRPQRETASPPAP